MGRKKDVVVQVIAAGTSTAIGFALTGKSGVFLSSVIAPVLQDVLLRQLSPAEKTRITRTAELSRVMIQEKLENGILPRKELENKSFKELCEGILLKARDSYEEYKLPLYANICTEAVFTDLPLAMLHEVLQSTEQLSYQQLCIIAIVDDQNMKETLSDKIFQNTAHTEDINYLSVYEDVVLLNEQGLLFHGSTSMGNSPRMAINVQPQWLFLTGRGKIICTSIGGISNFDKASLEDIFIKLQ